jgi:hypothetical protein
MAAFRAYQVQYIDRLRQANGLDLARAYVSSPAAAWLRFSLGSGFDLMAAHERRHLWQARNVHAGSRVSEIAIRLRVLHVLRDRAAVDALGVNGRRRSRAGSTCSANSLGHAALQSTWRRCFAVPPIP